MITITGKELINMNVFYTILVTILTIIIGGTIIYLIRRQHWNYRGGINSRYENYGNEQGLEHVNQIAFNHMERNRAESI